jgi:membrane protein YqaA with SNARE-associated domain
MVFVLGFKGREWAWRNKKWESVEHFQRVQRKWSLWSLLFVGVALLGVIAAIALPAYQEYTLRAAGA